MISTNLLSQLLFYLFGVAFFLYLYVYPTRFLPCIDFKQVEYLERTNTKHRKWHGDLGTMLWDLLTIAALTGLHNFFGFSLQCFFGSICVIIVWILVHSQLKRKYEDIFSSEININSDTENNILVVKDDDSKGDR